MPTLLRWEGFRFFFYSADGSEPAHVHIGKGDCEAKVWLHDLSVAASFGYSARELATIIGKVREQRDTFQEAWNAYFADRG